ncbi:major facilitator superfamily domain-containing protein [Pisolithus marmoratus]|nr:major facilitator superfamily domain-containing protein [Pisolithus marmoratus]
MYNIPLESCIGPHWAQTGAHDRSSWYLDVDVLCRLSKTFWGLVFSRCLKGALSGNIGVIKSMLAEITDATNLAQAWGVMPLAWFLGATIGPLIDSTFFKTYPYFLPCSVSATFAAIAWLVAYFWLEETIKQQVSVKDYFLRKSKPQQSDEGLPALTENSIHCDTSNVQLPLRKLLVPAVLIAAGCYAVFALTDIAVRTVLPVYLAIPMEMGGLGLDPSVIGTILALFGFTNGVSLTLFFAPLLDRLGPKKLLPHWNILIYPRDRALPCDELGGTRDRTRQSCLDPRWISDAIVRVCKLLSSVRINYLFHVTVSSDELRVGVIFIYVNAAAPNRASIGATNGLAQMMVSAMRAVGPAGANSVLSLSIQRHLMGGYFVYWVMVGMASITLVIGFFLPKKP